jgi:hypothetical protein
MEIEIRISFTSALDGRSRDSSVGITTDYGLDGQGSIPRRRKQLFSILQRPDWLWGPASLICNG